MLGKGEYVRIGILDDSSAILDYLTNALELAGHTVYAHTTSTSFLAQLFPNVPPESDLPYDLVLLDLLLAESRSGPEVYRLIREQIPREEMPIIFLTALSGNELEDIKFSFHEVPVLQKPFHLKELLHIIGEWVLT